jgi:hypothetical protein
MHVGGRKSSMHGLCPTSDLTWEEPGATWGQVPTVSGVQDMLSLGAGALCLYDMSYLSDKESIVKINLRGRRAYLYRRRWVPAGPSVPHAYPAEDYLGAIDVDAEAIPHELISLLTTSEQDQLHEKVLRPAAEAREAAARRESDPLWRIAEASRLLSEAAHLSQSGAVPSSSLVPVRQAAERIRLLEAAPARPQSAPPRPTVDKLSEAVVAIKAAAEAVRSGEYGRAPAEGTRSTRAYRLWSAVCDAVDGDERSLLRALQERGFVKYRKG